MKRLLFVCMGNICRSPAAEGVFLQHLKAANLSHLVDVDSAGTTSYHQGEPADNRMRAAAAKRGYLLNSRSRGLVDADLDEFDLIVAMDKANLTLLQQRGGRSKVVLFCKYLGDDWIDEEVPDPYYGGDDGFEVVLDMLEAGCTNLLKSMLNHDKA